jgi:E3 ubiquitin-protein ligase MARCH6
MDNLHHHQHHHIVDKVVEESSPPSPTSSSSPSSSSNNDDELICRICRENGNRETLVHPCKCSGSIRYVHEKCLLEWIEHSKTETCELCKHKFVFAKVYKTDAPAKLNFWEFIIGSVQLGKGTLQKLLRLAIVLVVWSFVTPLLTAWILRALLSNSILEFVDIPKRFSDEIALFQDCLIGAFLSIAILVFTIFIAGVKEFVNDILRNLNEHLQQNGTLVNANVNNEEQQQEDEEARDYSSDDSDDVVERPQEQLGGAQQDDIPMPIVFQDERDEDEAVDLEEFIGVKGSFISLIQNCILIIVMNAIYLFCLIFIPFTVGRGVLVLRSFALHTTSDEFVGTDIITKLSITAVGYTCIICMGLLLFVC